MKLIRRSIYSGNMHEMDLPLTYAKIRRWQDGWSIDRAFPDLTQEEIAFILNGTLPEEEVEIAMMEKTFSDVTLH